MLTAVDEGIGNITRTLQDVDRWNSTLLVLTSDNGAPTTGCGGAQGGQNWPLRGGKCSAWSGGNRVPALIRGPGVVAGRTLSQLAHVTDWGPTILSFVDPNNTRKNRHQAMLPLDGVDLKPALTKADEVPAARDTVLLEADPYAFPWSGRNFQGDQHATPFYAIRDAQYKLMIGDPGQPGIVDAYYCTGPPCPATHNNSANASAVPVYNVSTVLLFDLVNDPFESTNIAEQHPDVVARLRGLIEEYNATAASSAQQGLPDDPRADPKNFNNTVTPWM